MIQSHLDVLLHVDAHWSQVLVGVGYYDGLVLLEGGQESSLMGGQVVLTCPPTEETLQPLEEVIYTIINLTWWEWGSPCGFRSQLGDFLLLVMPSEECLQADVSLNAIKGWCHVRRGKGVAGGGDELETQPQECRCCVR